MSSTPTCSRSSGLDDIDRTAAVTQRRPDDQSPGSAAVIEVDDAIEIAEKIHI
jgi:hypothetical protein